MDYQVFKHNVLTFVAINLAIFILWSHLLIKLASSSSTTNMSLYYDVMDQCGYIKNKYVVIPHNLQWARCLPEHPSLLSAIICLCFLFPVGETSRIQSVHFKLSVGT